MRFLVDAQLPPALARRLVSQGHDAERVHDFGGDGVTDTAVWERARRNGAVIVTMDEDFVLRAMAPGPGPRVAWVRTGNVRRQNLLIRMEAMLPALERALAKGERVVELR